MLRYGCVCMNVTSLDSVGCVSHSESFPRTYGVLTALQFAIPKFAITFCVYFFMLMKPVLASLFLVNSIPTYEVVFVMVSVTVVMRGGSNNQEDGRATWERSMDVSLVESKQRTTCLEKKRN